MFTMTKAQHGNGGGGDGDDGDDGGRLRDMLTAEQILMMIPISRTTLFRMERDKVFPPGQPITPHRKLWFKKDVIAWQRALQDPDSELSLEVRARAGKKRKPGRPSRD